MKRNASKLELGPDSISEQITATKSHNLGEVQEVKKGFSRFTIFSMTIVLMATWEAFSSTMATALVSGGPVSLVYGCILAIIGAMATAASLGELTSMYPTAGGQYHFTAKLAPERCRNFLSWLVGWIGTFGWISFTASAPFLAATMIQGLMILNLPSYEPQRWHGTLLYWALVGLSTIINIWGSRLLSVVEGLSLFVHLAAFLANFIIILVVTPAKNSASFVFTLYENNSGWSSDGVAWSIGMLSSCYVLTGFDGAIHLAEEMPYPEVAVPYCMLSSVAINGTLGFAFVLAILFCMGDIEAALDTDTGYPIIEILRYITGSTAASTAMTCTLILMAVLATVALIPSASRMVWSLARDRAIPFHKYLSEVNTRTQLPQRSILITSVILVLLGLINIGSTAAFNAILSLSVLGIQISYAVPVALMLWRRLSSGKVILPYGPWKLGCYGVAINAISMVYLIYTSIFMVFPANQPVTALNMNYSSLVFGTVLIASCIYWVWKGTKQYDGPNIVIRPTA
ncbi:Amino acid/polyamine transporter I [Penicillium occitanis (nom. inval.)]|nr:Amino acid/polyamine transporter I [Penicillium occitanis (nom. inval.)]PCH09878.1 hypothetical protein PENOC_006320 [Penicillium occitanis (nom. inval.)]